MSLLEADLRTYLMGIAPVVALVVDRVYGLVRPPSSDLPAVMLQRTATTRQSTICRTSKLVSADMQVDSYAMTGQDAWSLATALRAALLDFDGTMGATVVNKVFLTNEFPLTDPDPGIIRVVQLYNFWYLED